MPATSSTVRPSASSGRSISRRAFGVDEQDATVRVDDDDAFADPVQHRLALVDQRRQLVQLESEGLALQAPGQQQ